MRVVKISNMSDDEKDKWLEQVQARETERINTAIAEQEKATDSFKGWDRKYGAYDSRNISINSNVPQAREFERQLRTGRRVDGFTKKEDEKIKSKVKSNIKLPVNRDSNVNVPQISYGPELNTKSNNSIRNKSNEIPLINSTNNFKNLKPSINYDDKTSGTEVTIADIKAREEAEQINEDIRKGDYSSAVGNVFNSFLGGVQRGFGGIANAGLVPIAGGLQRIGDLGQKVGVFKDEDNLFNNGADTLLDGADYIKDKSTYTDQVASQIDNAGIRTASTVFSTVGNMVPAIISNVVAPGSGLIVTGVSAGGNSAQETINNDRSNLAQAIITGVAKGGVEAGTEKLTGGNFLSKGSLDDIVNKAISEKITSKFGKEFLNKAYQYIGEIGEEHISNNIGYLIDKLVNNKDLPNFKEWFSEANETTKMTFLTTLLLDTIGLGGSKIENDEASMWINEAEKIIEQEDLKDSNRNKINMVQNEQINSQQTINNIPIGENVRQKYDNTNGVLPVDNVNNRVYNSSESESDINGTVQGFQRLPKQFDTRVQQEGEQEQVRKYTRTEYREWEQSIKPIEQNQLTTEQRKVTENIKRQYNKDIVFFNGENSKYNGGASLNNPSKIYINANEVGKFGLNRVVMHEVLESNIRHNEGLKNDIITPAIDKVIADSNFQQQKNEFWKNQTDDIPSDYAIAKDILCDRFAEMKSGEKLDYDNVLSNETNMTLDFAIENFENALNTKSNNTSNGGRVPYSNIDNVNMPVQNEIVNNSMKNNNILPVNKAYDDSSMMNNGKLPLKAYEYQKSDNVKVDNLRKDANRYFNNSKKARDYVSMLEKIVIDKDIDIRLDSNLTDSKGNVANGKYENGIITINPNSNRAGEFIAVHELTHAIGTDDMRNIINTYRSSNVEFDSAVKKLLANYDTTELTDEAMADVSAQLFGNQEFINNLSKDNPSLFKRIYNEIKYLWHQFRGYKNQNQFIEDLEYKWTQAYNSNNKLNDNTNYSFVGEHAQNRDVNRLLDAITLERQGKTSQEVYKQTGWYRGNEGKWRFEIPDDNFNIKESIIKKDGWYRLNEILDAPELYNAYPELKRTEIYFEDMKKNKGVTKPEENSITLNNDLIQNNDDAKSNVMLGIKNQHKVYSTLMHEIQHIIQYKEGFSSGSSMEYWHNKERQKAEKYVKNLPAFKNLETESEKNEFVDSYLKNNLDEYSVYSKYKNTAGEQEARNVQERIDMKPEDRNKIMPFVKNDDTVYAERQKQNYHISEKFSDEIDKSLRGEISSNNQVKARDYTPKILVDNGVKDLPMLLTQKHLRQIIYTKQEAINLGYKISKKDHYHGLGKETLLSAIDNLDNPQSIYKQSENNYFIITEVYDRNNNKIVVPIQINGKGTYNNVIIDENQISSVYGHKHLEDYLSENDYEKIYEKNRDTLNEGVISHNISNSTNSIASTDIDVNTINKYSMQESENNSGSFNLKQKQLEIINKSNPMEDNYHTGIRNVKDIKTFEETLQDSDWQGYDEFNPDYTLEMANEAMKTGEIMVYSSYPIEQGVFVSPSYMEAESYSGNGKVYSKKVKLEEIAWIDPTQGQYAKVNNETKYSRNNRTWQKYLDDNLKSQGTRTSLKDVRLLYSKNIRKNVAKNLDAIYNSGNLDEVKRVPIEYVANLQGNGGYRSLEYVADLKENIVKNGIENPIELVRRDNGTFEIENGNHRLQVAKEIGMQEVPVKFVESWDNVGRSVDQSEINFVNTWEKNYDRNNTNSAKIDRRYDRGEVIKGNRNDNRNKFEDRGTTTENDRLYREMDGYNNGSSSVTASGEDIKGNSEVEKSTSFVLPTKQATAVATDSLPPSGKQRKHYKSIMESKYTSPEAKAIAKELLGSDLYVPETNEGQLKVADKRIEVSGADSELDSLSGKVVSGTNVDSMDIAVGERLIQYYSKTGDKERLSEAIRTTAMAGTKAGQTVQAMSLLNHQTPEGQAVWIERSVEKMNNELKKMKGDKKNKGDNVDQFNFTPEMKEKIVSSKGKEELQRNLNEVYEELGKQVPKTFAQKVDSWRYFAMLANPRTHIRNIIGNKAMAGMLYGVKNRVAGSIEGVASKFNSNMDRTHTVVPTSKEVKAFAKADIKNVADRLGLNENKYNPKSRLENSMRTFKSDALENTLGKLYGFNNNLLEVEDGWGLKSGYVKSLAGYMTANGLKPDTITDSELGKARNFAVKEAKEATFHQDSQLASLINQLGNKNKFSKFVLDAVLPFKKTPINVAKSGIEYSPIGLVKSAVFDVAKLRKGNISVNEYIDNVSKGLTGTGIALMGYALASAGVISASGSDDEDKEKYEEALGNQSYSIRIGDNTYSLDWIAPTGIPFFIGAECYEISKQEDEKKSSASDDDSRYNRAVKGATNVLNAFTNAMNPMTEMSMLSGLTSALKSFDQGSAEMFASMGTNAVKSYVNQFVPTALGQVAKTGDEYERSTTSTKSGVLPKAVDTTRLQVMSKVPGLRQMLPVKTDIWGNEQKQAENVVQRFFENAVLPYSRKEVKHSAVDDALLDLYNDTGNGSILPEFLDKSLTVNKKKFVMTGDEYAKYKKSYSKDCYNLLDKLVVSKDYKDMSNEEREIAVSKVYSYAKEKVKVDYAKGTGESCDTSSLYDTMRAIYRSGGNESAYLSFVAKTQGVDKANEKINILANIDCSNNTKEAIYVNGVGKSDKDYSVLKKTKINVSEYLKYKVQDFSSDRKDDGTVNGKAVSGSKQNKVVNYLNSMKVTGNQRLLLYAMNGYKLSSSQRSEVVRYVESLNLSRDEAMRLYDKFSGFTVYKDGRIKY